MINIKHLDSKLLYLVSETLKSSFVGVIYLDFSEFLFKSYNEKEIYQEIHTQMNEFINYSFHNKFPIFASEEMMGDFFLFAELKTSDLKEAQILLYELNYKVKEQLENKLRAIFVGHLEVELYMGSTLVANDISTIESLIFSSMKHAMREIKKLSSRDIQHLEKFKSFKQIIKKQTIQAVFQPIVSLKDASVLGYEALTRVPDNSIFHDPAVLFNFAEEVGSLYELDQLSRVRALEGCVKLGVNQKVFINLHPYIIHDPQFTPGKTLGILHKYGLYPSNVVFEITERSSIDNFTTVKKVLEHYRSQGYQIAIDDAGAGYSSLQAIAELQPDLIKVDRSMIQNIHQDRIKENILETFVMFADKMNSKIIAEGIENIEELKKLIQLGVHYGQGYLLRRPHDDLMPIHDEIVDLIKTHNFVM